MAVKPAAGKPTAAKPIAAKPAALVRELLELVDALDRRVPRVERIGEIEIAREAAALKARALLRIAELERQAARAASR